MTSIGLRFACPKCGEKDPDELVWVSDDTVQCQTCGNEYDPDQAAERFELLLEMAGIAQEA